MPKTKGSKTNVSEESENPILPEEILEETLEEQEEEIREVIYSEESVKNAFYSYMRGNDPQVIGRAWEKFKHHLK